MAAVGGNRLDHAGSAILRAECALGPRVARSKDDDAADALAFVHQVEALVDLFQRQHMGDHRVDLDLAVHVPVDDLGYVGAALRPAESRVAPVAPGDKQSGRAWGRESVCQYGLISVVAVLLKKQKTPRDITTRELQVY